MVFHSCLSDTKFSQVSKTLHSILADRNNALYWIVSPRPLISKSSSPCTNPLVTVSRALIITGITVTFVFHSFFSSLARSMYLSLFSLSFSFNLWSAGTVKSTIWQLHVLFCWLTLGQVVWPRLNDPFQFQNPKEFYTSHFLGGLRIVHTPFVHMVKFKLLARFPVDHLPHSVLSNLILSWC